MNLWIKQERKLGHGVLSVSIEGKSDGTDGGIRRELKRVNVIATETLNEMEDALNKRLKPDVGVPARVAPALYVQPPTEDDPAEPKEIAKPKKAPAKKAAKKAPAKKAPAKKAPAPAAELSEDVETLQRQILSFAFSTPEAQKERSAIGVLPPDEAEAATKELKTKYVLPFLTHALGMTPEKFGALTVQQLQSVLQVLQQGKSE